MRLHIDDLHGPDPIKAALMFNAEVTVDGVVVKAIMADEEKGEARVLIEREDPDFHIEMRKQGGDCWPTRLVKGNVVIKDLRHTSTIDKLLKL